MKTSSNENEDIPIEPTEKNGIPESDYAKAITLGELFARDYPPPVLWTQFFGYKGFLHLLVADPDAGKTYTLYSEMLRFAEAGYKSFFAHFDTDGFGTMTAYFRDFINPTDLEKPESDVMNRIKILSCNEGGGLITWESLEQNIQDFNPDFVVYDSLMPMVAMLEKEVPEQGNTPVWHTLMKRIKNLSPNPSEVAVVVNHHLNKKGVVNGNQGIISGSDAVTIMKKMNASDVNYSEDTRFYHAIKLRNIDERDFHLTLKKDGKFYTFQKSSPYSHATKKLVGRCEDILNEMLEEKDEIPIKQTVSYLKTELGVSRRTVMAAVKAVGLRTKKDNRKVWIK